MNFLANAGYLASFVKPGCYATPLWTAVKITMNQVELPGEHPLLPKAYDPIAQENQLRLLKTGTPRAISGYILPHNNADDLTSFRGV